MKWVVSVALLDAIYLGVLGSVSFADASVGAVWAVLFLCWGRAQVWSERDARSSRPSWISRSVWFVPLAAVVLRDGVCGSIRALRASGGAHAAPVLVEVPYGERSRTGIAVGALCSTISPGVVFLGLDERRRVMLFGHADGGDPEAARRAHIQFYERFQRRVFP